VNNTDANGKQCDEMAVAVSNENDVLWKGNVREGVRVCSEMLLLTISDYQHHPILAYI